MCDVIKKAKYDLSDNIMFNISVNSVITTGKESATSMNATHTMDSTSGNIWKNFINNELRLKISILICVKNVKYQHNQQL